MTSVTVRVRVHKSRDAKRLMLEPWTDEVSFLPDETFLDVELSGDPEWPISVEVTDDMIVVGTFDSGPGAAARVLRNGVAILERG